MLKQNKPIQTKKPLKAKTQLRAKSSLKTKSALKKTPKHPVSKLKKEADRVWSIATRYRFAEKIASGWIVKCVTCNRILPFGKAQCGHFQSRRFNATRYSEPNTAPQCFQCNISFAGEQYRFASFIDDFYGIGTAQELALEARQSHRFTRDELQAIIDDCLSQIAFYVGDDGKE